VKKFSVYLALNIQRIDVDLLIKST